MAPPPSNNSGRKGCNGCCSGCNGRAGQSALGGFSKVTCRQCNNTAHAKKCPERPRNT